MTEKGRKIEFFNRKARHDYEVLESLEAGIELTGSEIKAIRSGRINITNSFAKVMNGEVWWLGGEIRTEEGDATRTRKLLLHKEQIKRLTGQSAEKGLALLPLKLYLTNGKAKIELGVAKGLKKYDKREILKKRDQEKEIIRKFRTK